MGSAPLERAREVERALAAHASPKKAASSSWFFKTGPGQYGEGEVFIGVTVPEQRKVAKAFCGLPQSELAKLLKSPVHEHRLTALLILTYQVERLDRSEAEVCKEKGRARSSGRSRDTKGLEGLVRFYLAHLDRVNNWDLVDLSAPSLLGTWCVRTGTYHKLYTFARSKNLWHKRVAIVATLACIRAGDLSHTFALARILLCDQHDLIHKAVGWMLREAGKRDQAALRQFLAEHGSDMPRTMFRYAIERFPKEERVRLLAASKGRP